MEIIFVRYMMKTVTKLLGLTLIISMTVLLSSCADDPVYHNDYYEGGNAEIQKDNILLTYDSWIENSDFDYQWYQEFQLSGYNLSADGVVLAFQKNVYNAWESLPMTTVLWTEDGTTYSEELWYSFTENGEFLVFDYRNTHPIMPTAPSVEIPIKLYIIDEYLYSSIKQEGIDVNNFNEFNSAIDAADYKVQAIDIEFKK